MDWKLMKGLVLMKIKSYFRSYKLIVKMKRHHFRKVTQIQSQGSYSVEISLIFPIIIIVIFALIYLTFYLHDDCVIKATIDDVLERGNFLIKHESDMKEKLIHYENLDSRGIYFGVLSNYEKEKDTLSAYLKERLGKGLFVTYIDNIYVNTGWNDIHISVQPKYNIGIPAINKYLFQNGRKESIEYISDIHNPSEFIRGYEVFSEVVKEVK